MLSIRVFTHIGRVHVLPCSYASVHVRHLMMMMPVVVVAMVVIQVSNEVELLMRSVWAGSLLQPSLSVLANHSHRTNAPMHATMPVCTPAGGRYAGPTFIGTVLSLILLKIKNIIDQSRSSTGPRQGYRPIGVAALWYTTHTCDAHMRVRSDICKAQPHSMHLLGCWPDSPNPCWPVSLGWVGKRRENASTLNEHV